MDFFIDLLNANYSKDNVDKILNGLKSNRVMSFRVNTIKSNLDEVVSVLKANNIEYTLVDWCSFALVVDSLYKPLIENLDIYKNGFIYVQSLSSMLPPVVMEPNEKSTILDMCASPGGKTTEIAALTNNNAQITACELNKIRMEKLKYNIDKQGAKSVYIMNVDSRNLDDFYKFDSVLLDAPCSGSGTINIDNENTFKYFTKVLIDKSSKTQKNLLNKALNVLNVGKTMVYSTCSILPIENEDVVNSFILDGRCEVVPIDESKFSSIPLLPTKIKGTMCVCPNKNYEGFFVAKLKKLK